MRRFLISDTHFGHDNVYKFKDNDGVKGTIRPWAKNATEGDAIMLENWNSVVKPTDKVYHLGDVAFRRSSLDILSKMNGKKILIKGNHDIFDLKDYAKYFVDIRGTFDLYDYVLTHVPIHPDELYRWKGNIHGHLHARVVDDTRYFNVSVEQINATPILFDEVVERLW